MIRFLAPYLVPVAIGTIAAAVAYSVGWISVLAVYGIVIVVSMPVAVRYARWLERQHPDQR
jgi:hypothetical protein